MTIHIVCRGCEFEALEDDPDEVDRIIDTHEHETGHDIDDERVDDGVELGCEGGWLDGVKGVSWKIGEFVKVEDPTDPTTYICKKCNKEGLATDPDTGFICPECGEPRIVRLVDEEDPERIVQVGQVEVSISEDDTVADLYEKINRNGDSLNITPVNTALCRPFSAESRPTPPDDDDRISFGLDEVEHLDKLELYRVPKREQPVYRDAAATDGGQPALKLTDDGIEIPDGVDLSQGVVFRARGATVDHNPGSTDRPFYPAVDERHLEEQQEHGVINEELDAYEVSIKPYGEDAETYRVQVPATDGGSEADSETIRWWGRPFDARRYHVFEGKGVARSLCENWQLRHDGKDPEVDPDEDTFTEGEDCKECAREAGVLDDE